MSLFNRIFGHMNAVEAERDRRRYLTAYGRSAILAPRLARQICPHRRVEYQPRVEQLQGPFALFAGVTTVDEVIQNTNHEDC
jgi:hypothetical protein